MLVTFLLSLGLWAGPAWAHDPPVMLPAQLDFDASSAPTKCNDQEGFLSILHAWVPKAVLQEDAARRLVVRIGSSAKGGKRADVSLVDEQGVVVAERHTPYLAKEECHKVLWAVAQDAAIMLGAFEPPPPKEAVTCPAIPAISPAHPCPVCPTCPRLRVPVPTMPISPAPTRFFAGLGGFVSSGIFEKLNAGPVVLVGVVPFRRLPQVHLEWEGAWTSQTIQSIRVQAVPLVGSACWVRGIVRFCGGLATTILFSHQLSNHESRSFGPSIRIGTQLFNHGPLSIRADVHGRVAPLRKSFGPDNVSLDRALPLTAVVAVMGMWAVD